MRQHKRRVTVRSECWSSSAADPALRHREMWESHHGEIPEGFEIHHIDLDRSNNDIGNLQCLSPEDHEALHVRIRDLRTRLTGRKRAVAKKTVTPEQAVRNLLSRIDAHGSPS